MKAEIIAVGSELLTPDRTDTNSLHLTRRLNEAGFEVHLKSIVGDDAADIEALVRAALRRSRLIVLCGGLGPTEDDLTRAGVARALHRSVTRNEEVLESLRRRFAQRGYRMAAINERQADVIEGAEVLANRVGTAPGMWISEGGTCLALLPGPPRELHAMVDAEVMPRASAMGGGRRLASVNLGIQGLTESELDTRIAPIYREYQTIQTTVLAARGLISVRLQRWLAPGESSEDLESLRSRIYVELGDAIFTDAGETLEEVVGGLLRRSGKSLAVAESCTAGLIGAAITRVPGSSEYFDGGVICYSNDLKVKLCHVPEDLLLRHGAVSSEAAEAMARGIRQAAGSRIGLSVTGIAGPGGGSEQKPVGLVYIGIADESRCTLSHRILPGDRQTVRELATNLALGRLRRFLIARETVA